MSESTLRINCIKFLQISMHILLSDILFLEGGLAVLSPENITAAKQCDGNDKIQGSNGKQEFIVAMSKRR